MLRNTLSALGVALTAFEGVSAAAAPVVENPSFEVDVYHQSPGYAPKDGSGITGWTYSGNLGINPWWAVSDTRQAPQYPFADNGIIPDGRQVALMQNICELRQRVEGFEKGRRYGVPFYKTARHNNAPDRQPRLEVSLGGETIVSAHDLPPVEDIGLHTLPYDYVESAVFTAPADGAFDLAFRTLSGNAVTVLLDQIEIVAAD